MPSPSPSIRPPWSRSDRAVPAAIVRPLQEFLRSSTASALPLLVAPRSSRSCGRTRRGGVATNSCGPRRWSLRLGRWAIDEDLRFWVDEGLMTLFFLLAGLEIKRELATGELRDRRAADRCRCRGAIGGMVVPALIFLAITHGTAARRRLGHGDADRPRVRARRSSCSPSRAAAAAGAAVPAHARDRRRPR